MQRRNGFAAMPMRRMAIVAPISQLRAVLVAIADAGVVEVERIDESHAGPAAAALQRVHGYNLTSSDVKADPNSAVLASEAPDLAALATLGDVPTLRGEVELESVSASARQHGDVAALVGWSPTTTLNALALQLAPYGGSVVPLATPPGVDPPTLISDGGATGAFQPLVDTYATVPYADINPSAFAGVAYVVMFGMMFGDVGDGALLTLAGIALACKRPRAAARISHLAPFVIGAGLASIGFGLAFGEMFGPTLIVPTLWLRPLDHATTLLAVAVAAGAGLLAVAYGFGTINRWREGGPTRALLATSGIAGMLLYFGLATVGLGWYIHAAIALAIGGTGAAAGLVLGFLGCYGETTGHLGGIVQAAIELFDTVLRLGTNTVSFARLAAFGLTHAALSGLVWSATDGLWHRGSWLSLLEAVVVFVIGNTVTFGLEALVAGIQALRLEYYELFSRVFTGEGRTFRPWHIPTVSIKENTCSPG